MDMNQNFFEKLINNNMSGSTPDLPDLDCELNYRGKAIRPDFNKAYLTIVNLLIFLNFILLSIFLGICFKSIILHSPILKFIGCLTAGI
jgi:hypothetical protein